MRAPTVHSFQKSSRSNKRNTCANSDSESESDDEIQHDPFNNSLGLRTISEKVLRVLVNKGTTTYKQVSDLIT